MDGEHSLDREGSPASQWSSVCARSGSALGSTVFVGVVVLIVLLVLRWGASRIAIRPMGVPVIRSGSAFRREEFEALGLLFGMLGVLLALVVAGGATSPYGP